MEPQHGVCICVIHIVLRTVNDEIKTRLNWIRLYFEIDNAEIVCRKYGISRPTLRKWLNRYKKLGTEGLNKLSKRPKKIKTKVSFKMNKE
jgi:transposase-like protein